MGVIDAACGLFDRIRSNVRHQCRIKWTPHTLVIWDNYSVQHQAVFDYQGFTRYGERLTVAGSGRLTLGIQAAKVASVSKS